MMIMHGNLGHYKQYELDSVVILAVNRSILGQIVNKGLIKAVHTWLILTPTLRRPCHLLNMCYSHCYHVFSTSTALLGDLPDRS